MFHVMVVKEGWNYFYHYYFLFNIISYFLFWPIKCVLLDDDFYKARLKMLKCIQKQKQSSISSLLPEKKKRAHDHNSNGLNSIASPNHGSSLFSNDSHNNQQPKVEIP